MSAFERVAVVGAGAWGTALANAAARAGRDVVLIVREAGRAEALAATRENPRLPGAVLAATVRPVAKIEAVAAADAVLLVVPAQALRGVAEALRPHVAAGVPVISCAKGLERGTLQPMTQVIAAELPAARPAVLSGPSFAADVAAGLPTAVTLAAHDEWLAAELAAALATPVFRLYHSDDVIGVEIGGAAKNVLAIAAGIAAGRELGASAGAALIARGFAELRRLGVALGAHPDTLMGLSGLGDLVLSSTSRQSRNFALGWAIGAGEPARGDLAEGAFTAEALVALGGRHEVELPIAVSVRDVLAGTLSIEAAVDTLLARPLRAEH